MSFVPLPPATILERFPHVMRRLGIAFSADCHPGNNSPAPARPPGATDEQINRLHRWAWEACGLKPPEPPKPPAHRRPFRPRAKTGEATRAGHTRRKRSYTTEGLRKVRDAQRRAARTRKRGMSEGQWTEWSHAMNARKAAKTEGGATTCQIPPSRAERVAN